MDRKKKRVSYMAGTNAAYRTPYSMNEQKKKKKKMSLPTKAVMIVAVLVLAVVISVALSMTGSERNAVGKATRIGATLSQNIMPFGDKVIFYDGTTLHCVAATGGNEWSYQIGVQADYHAADERIVAWSGDDLFILNDRGRLIFNNKMTGTIQFASAGDEYVAAFIGEPDNGVVTVINSEGKTVDNIPVNDQTLLDIGFFYATTSSSAQPTELMWMLGINTTGTVISTELQTFQPGKLVTGKSSLGEHIAYKVYGHNEMLHIVDTREIKHFNYRGLAQAESTLVYGYEMADVKAVGKTLYQLLVPEQEANNIMEITSVRLMHDNVDRVLHLPSRCMAARLGTNSVYGFSDNAVYVCRYGETTFSSYTLPVNVTAILGMITENRVVAASGSEIYLIELPT